MAENLSRINLALTKWIIYPELLFIYLNMKRRYSGIYTITNISNGKIYVGQAINMFYRWSEHRCSLRNKYFENDRLQKAWNKYGEKSFIFEVLVECEERFLNSEEHYWATILKSHNREYGYNLRPTNPEGKSRAFTYGPMSKETKAKIFTEERNKKISITKTGIPRNQNTKDKLSNYWKGQYEKNLVINPMQDKKHSQETKDKIREKALSREKVSVKELVLLDINKVEIERMDLKKGLILYGTNIYYLIKKKKSKNGKFFKIENKH